MKQSGKSCYRFANPTEDGNPSALGPSQTNSPNTSSAGAWQPVTSTFLSSATPSPPSSEITLTSHKVPQTLSPTSLSHPPTATLNYTHVEDKLFSTQTTSSQESYATMSLLTLTSAVTSLEDTHASTTEEEATTPLWSPFSVEASTKDLSQTSQSVHQTQTAKPEATTITHSFTLGLSHYATQPSATTMSVTVASQKPETQYDVSEQTTLRDDSPDSSTEVTFLVPIASSTGKSGHGVTSACT